MMKKSESSDTPTGDRSPGRRPSLATSTSLTFVTQLTVSIASLVNVVIISRALGPAGRGEVVFLTTVAFISAQFAALSVSEAASNIAGGTPQHRRALASNSIVLAVLFGGLTVGLLVALFHIFPDLGPHAGAGPHALMMIAIAPLILQGYFERIVQADYGFKIVNAAWLIPALANVVVNGALYAVGAISVASAFGVWVAGQLVALALLWWYIAKRLAGFGRPNSTLGREMVTFGIKAHGSRVLMWGNYRLDQWFVGAIAGARELGLYSVAVAWAEGLFLLPQALSAAQRPDLVRVNRKAAGAQASTAFRILTLMTIPLVLVTLLMAPLLCVGVFGVGFRGAIGDLRILAIGAFGIISLKVLGGALIAQRKPLLETIASVVAFLATIALDLLLIPRFGGAGAALASTVAYTAGGATIMAIAARTLSIPARAFIPRRADLITTLVSVRKLIKRLLGAKDAGTTPAI